MCKENKLEKDTKKENKAINLFFIGVIISLIALFSFFEKNAWVVGVFGLAFFIFFNLENLKDSFESIELFKFLKIITRAEKATKKAEQKIEEMKELAGVLSDPIIMFNKFIRWNSSISRVEKIKYRNEIRALLKKTGHNQTFINKSFFDFDEHIMQRIWYEKYGSNNYKDLIGLLCNEIGELLEKPLIDEARKKAKELEIYDDDFEYLLEETEYFFKNNTFKNIDKLEKIAEKIEKAETKTK